MSSESEWESVMEVAQRQRDRQTDRKRENVLVEAWDASMSSMPAMLVQSPIMALTSEHRLWSGW